MINRIAIITGASRGLGRNTASIWPGTLLSDENRWVNGQRIEVSGGMAL